MVSDIEKIHAPVFCYFGWSMFNKVCSIIKKNKKNKHYVNRTRTAKRVEDFGVSTTNTHKASWKYKRFQGFFVSPNVLNGYDLNISHQTNT